MANPLEGLGLQARRAVWSQASMESRGQPPSDELLQEIREALEKDEEEGLGTMPMMATTPPPSPPAAHNKPKKRS